MYRASAKETVVNFTKGFNGTIFAYGQSGSGKTFSMLGPEEVIEVIKQGGDIAEDVQNMYGIIPRAIREFFEYHNSAIDQEGAKFEIGLNYFEIYKESLNNLIARKGAVYENLKVTPTKVYNADPTPVHSPEEIFYWIQ